VRSRFLPGSAELGVPARTPPARPGARAGAGRSARDAAREAVVDALRVRAREPSPDVRRAVASVLGEVGGAAARAEIGRLLSDRSDRVRRAAVLALDRVLGGTPRELARIRRFLADPAPRVRAGAAVVLGRRRDRTSVPALLARLRAPGTWEKPSVAIALGRIGDRRAVPALVALAARPERWLRVCALHALGEIGAREGRATVRAGLADPAWSVRGAAATALGRLGTPTDVPHLVELLDDPHPWPRRGALYALGHLGRGEVARRIRAALTDPAPDVRVAACWALGEVGDRASRRTIAEFLVRCPLPSPGGTVLPPPTADAMPATGTESLQFETAVAALARLGPARAGTPVDRALAEAERRVGPAGLARATRPAFGDRSGGRPTPTLRELFARARAPPAREGPRR
jgi:HEAT repeat protein